MGHELRKAFTLNDEITLRTFIGSDSEAVLDLVKRNEEHLQEFMRWMTPDYSRSSAEAFVEKAIASAESGDGLGLAIIRNGQFIGSIGFVLIDWCARKTEIGYWLDKAQEGKGIVSAACKLLIEYAFEELGLNRIEIRCAADNLRSAAIPERLGFRREGVLRQSEFRNGRLHDFNLYGLLAADRQDLEL